MSHNIMLISLTLWHPIQYLMTQIDFKLFYINIDHVKAFYHLNIIYL